MKKDVAYALKHSDDPTAALALADLLEEQGAPEADVGRWRLCGEWLAEVARQIEGVEQRWPELLTDRGALKRISAQDRRFNVDLPCGVRARFYVAFRHIEVTIDWTDIPCRARSRTYNLSRDCLSNGKRARYLRDRVRQMADEYLGRNTCSAEPS